MVYIHKLKIITFCVAGVEYEAKELPYFNTIVKNTKDSQFYKK